MKIMAVLLLVNSALTTSDLAKPKGWRGIVPLHSTRADVERLLLPDARNDCVPSACTYYLRDANVQFNYSPGDCKSGRGFWDVPEDTVVAVTVYPKPQPLLSDLRIDERDFEKRKLGHIEGMLYYENEKEGLQLEVYAERVQVFRYGPVAEDKHLRCTSRQGAKEIEKQ